VRALLATLLVAAAAAAPAAATGADTRHRIASTPASIALPDGWRTLTRAQVVRNVVPAAIKQNPQLAPILRALRSASSPLRFFAFDTRLTTGFATNVNTIVTAQPGLTFAEFARALVAEVESGAGGLKPIGRPTHRQIRLPSGPALLVLWRLPVSAQGTRRVAVIRQYGLLDAGRAYVFTFTTLTSTVGRYAPVFDRAARSIRFS
jgi:hypothetical protein